MTAKLCNRCYKYLPANLSYFWSDKNKTTGLSTICKICKRDNVKKQVLDNKEKGTRICAACKQEYPLNKEYYTTDVKLTGGFRKCCKTCIYLKKDKGSTRKKSDMIMKRCCNCKEVLPLNNIHFQASSRKRDKGFKSRCRDCSNIARKDNDKKCGISTVLGRRYDSLKRRYSAKNREIGFDRSYLREVWDKQNGFCAISKIKMTHLLSTGSVKTNVSVDRIDSSKGYTKDNIQLVCAIINTMKMDMIMLEFIKYCKIVCDNFKDI